MGGYLPAPSTIPSFRSVHQWGIAYHRGPATLSAANDGTCTATGTGCLVVNIGGYAGIGVQLTGTWVGTVTFEVTIDGTTWAAQDMTQTTSTTPTTTTTGNGIWVGATVGTKMRVRFSTRSSGSVVASIRATMNVASSGFGTGVNGSSGAPVDATYVVQTSNGTLTNEQVLGVLATGLMKSTTTTGVVSIAASADIYGLWSGTCNSTSFLRGDGACSATSTGSITATDFISGSTSITPLRGVTGSISGALTLGTCDTGTAAVTGATTAMVAAASPTTYPGVGVVYGAYVSGANVVTVWECGLAVVTPTATTYQVSVLR